jgi:hypothetical protein
MSAITAWVDDVFPGMYHIDIHQMNREDAIELANILRSAQSSYLREAGIEIESELMEVQ